MRIEAYTQIQQLYNTSKAGKTQEKTFRPLKLPLLQLRISVRM